MEVFDLETQTWSSVKNPRVFWLHEEDRVKGFVAKSVWLEGKLYLFGDESVVYNQAEDSWDPIGMDNRSMAWAARFCHCVIDDVLFFWDGEVFRWWDFKASSWKVLSGIEGLPDLDEARKYCKMVDLGGKIGFLWPEYPLRNVGSGVLRFRLKGAMEMRFVGRLSGLIMCLEHMFLVPRSMLFLLLFD